MAQKDITEKILEAYNDVFADIVNVLLFDGEEVLKPDELEEQTPRSAYKADGKFREIERDVAIGEARGRAEALREVAAKIKAGYSIEEILAASQVQ